MHDLNTIARINAEFELREQKLIGRILSSPRAKRLVERAQHDAIQNEHRTVIDHDTEPKPIINDLCPNSADIWALTSEWE